MDELREEAILQALRLIGAQPGIIQRGLAGAMGISVGATYYMLRALAECGLVKLGRFSAATDKRGFAYFLTPKGLAEKTAITACFLIRKRAEYEALGCEIDELSGELGHIEKSEDNRFGSAAGASEIF